MPTEALCAAYLLSCIINAIIVLFPDIDWGMDAKLLTIFLGPLGLVLLLFLGVGSILRAAWWDFIDRFQP